MGWASSVKLYISQISMEFKAGFSVIESFQRFGTGLSDRSSVPSRAAMGPWKPGNVLTSSLSDTCGVWLAVPRGLNAGNVSRAGSWLVSRLSRRTPTNFITWPAVSGSAGEICDRYALSEGLVRALVDEIELGPLLNPSEVDDDISPFGRRHEELLELHQHRQEGAVDANLSEGENCRRRLRRQRIADDLQDQEAGVGAVEAAEAVAPRLDVEPWPFRFRPGIQKRLQGMETNG
jgi:hypothetical protein